MNPEPEIKRPRYGGGDDKEAINLYIATACVLTAFIFIMTGNTISDCTQNVLDIDHSRDSFMGWNPACAEILGLPTMISGFIMMGMGFGVGFVLRKALLGLGFLGRGRK